jgi:hypothetical protein
MHHLDDGQWGEQGCFLHQLLTSAHRDRSQLNVGYENRTSFSFDEGELVSTDLVQLSRTPKSHQNGPFLRLSGWMLELKYNDGFQFK